MFKQPLLPLGLLALNSLTSCAANTTATVPVVTPSEYCLIAKAITFSEPHGVDVETSANLFDTPTTIQQIKDHDLAYESVCGAKTENK